MGGTATSAGSNESRDRETVRAFAAVAARQYGLERRRSTSVTAVLLGALDAVLAQWRIDPTEENGEILEETYLAMVVGAYSLDSARPVVARVSHPRGSGSQRVYV